MSTIINNFSYGEVNNTYSNEGNVYTVLSGVTGNFVNMTFYFDAFTLETGLNVSEGFVSRDFSFTGYSLGVINSGNAGTALTGKLYQRTTTNTKVNFADFSLANGSLFIANGGYNQTISGLNRIGVDLLGVPTGMTGLSVGVFGIGY